MNPQRHIISERTDTGRISRVMSVAVVIALTIAAAVSWHWYRQTNHLLSQKPDRKTSSIQLQAVESTLGLQAKLPYADLRLAAERATSEAKTGGGEKRYCDRWLGVKVCATALWTYRIERSGPVNFETAGNHVRLRLPLRFSGVVGIDGPAARMLGFTNKDLTGSLQLIANIRLDVDNNWCPIVRSQLTYEWTKEPRLRVLARMKINLRSQADRALEKKIPELQKQLADVIDCRRFKKRLQAQWKTHYVPLRLATNEQNYLKISPQRLAFSGSEAKGDHLLFSLAVDAITETVTEPPADKADLALPPPDGNLPTTGDVEFSLLLRVEYADLQTLLTNELIDKTFKSKAATLTINSVELYPSDQQLVMRIGFSVSSFASWLRSRGELYISAEPQISQDGSALQFNNLQMTRILDRKLWRLVSTILNEQILARLRAASSVDLSRSMEKVEIAVAEALSNPKKTAGIRLNYSQPRVALIAVNPEASALAAIVHVSTNLQATLPRRLLMPE